MEKKDIIQFISSASGSYSPYQLFYDWVKCLALSIVNTCSIHHGEIWQEREKEYLQTFNRHDKKTQDMFMQATFALVEIYENCFDDVLGDIYMKSGCGNKNTGQFFTPYHLARLMAELSLPKDLTENDKIPLNEPTCGGGANIIATADVLHSRGLNYQKMLWVVGQDLDYLAVYMTYIACSFYGIDAIIVQGDTLQDPYVDGYDERRIFRTPMNVGALL